LKWNNKDLIAPLSHIKAIAIVDKKPTAAFIIFL